MLVRIIVTIFLIFGGAFVVNAQRSIPQPSAAADRPNDRDPFNSPVEQMRARMAVRMAEKDHQDNLDRATEAARIGAELKTSFLAANVLSKDDRKKVERLEKLLRKIRSDADGSDGDVDVFVPADLGDAINRIAKETDELNKRVTATPKLVVSAAVVEQANQLLELVKYVRGSSK